MLKRPISTNKLAWHAPVIPAAQEAIGRRIIARGQPWAKKKKKK
jgi:hypothetical protein